MNKPATLLILGGSNCQINAFKYARNNNIKTVLFDYYDDPPAARLADAHYKISTFDVDACLEKASLLGASGVMTLGTDQPVYTAAVIAKTLGLPSFLDVETALSVTNKEVMHAVLERHGIPAAESHVVDKAGLAALDLDGPVVIKPLDSQGQKGVFLAKSVSQAGAWFDDSVAFSKLDRILCQRYYPSNEITVSAWVSGGRCVILTVTDRVSSICGRSIGVCRSHRFPSHYAAGYGARVLELAKDVAKAFSIQEGPLYIQMLVGDDGVLINEVACRIGGAFEDVFIPKLTGFDILAAAVDGALYGQKPVEVPVSRGKTGYATVLMVFSRNRVISRLPELSDIRSIPFVCDAGFNYKEGDAVPAFENSGARIGYAVIVTDTSAQMESSVNEFWRIMGSEFTG